MLIELLKQTNYVWRVLATSLSFIVFSLGGFLISQLIIPVACLFISSKSKRCHRAQEIIHTGFWAHIEMMKFFGIMTTEIIGAEKISNKRPQLFLANHPTLIDVVLMLSLIPRTNCIVKQDLFKNFFLRGVVNSAGYISNSAEPQVLIQDCVDSLQSGQSLVVFPEGTRTTPGEGMKFQRVPARIAIEASQNITPVTITCQPSTLTKDKKWYQIPDKKFHIRIKFGEELELNSIVEPSEPVSVSVRKLTRFLVDYFQKDIIQHEAA